MEFWIKSEKETKKRGRHRIRAHSRRSQQRVPPKGVFQDTEERRGRA